MKLLTSTTCPRNDFTVNRQELLQMQIRHNFFKDISTGRLNSCSSLLLNIFDSVVAVNKKNEFTIDIDIDIDITRSVLRSVVSGRPQIYTILIDFHLFSKNKERNHCLAGVLMNYADSSPTAQ